MSANLPPGVGLMDLPGSMASFWRCLHCDNDWPFEIERRECHECGKTACLDCLESCECGCGEDAHKECMIQYKTKFNGQKAYWFRSCVEDHIAQLEREAAEYRREAERAKEAIRRSA